MGFLQFRWCRSTFAPMKTIAFFSAKGGTGKTTFNLLLASWLHFQQGKHVAVLDFDAPEFNLSYTRKRELQYLEKKEALPPDESLYPILEIHDYKGRISRDEIHQMVEEAATRLDYLIMDFGGSFDTGDPVLDMVQDGLLDLLVIPVELDGMILSSGKTLATVLSKIGQRTLLFFNKVHGKEKPQLYTELEQWLGEDGLTVSPHRVKNTVKLRRDADNGSNFLRSSVSFPQKEMEETNPELIRLFEEVAGDGD